MFLLLLFGRQDMVSVVTLGYIFTPEDLELGTTEEQGERDFYLSGLLQLFSS